MDRHTTFLEGIVCVNNKWAIGKDGDLLYDIPDDKRMFRVATTNKSVIMGYKTFESLRRPHGLSGRNNIVLTHRDIEIPGVIIVHLVEEAMNCVDHLGSKGIVIGGGEIYQQFLPHCDYFYITMVDDNADGDVTFPRLDEDPEWRRSSTTGFISVNDRNKVSYLVRYQTYMRKHTINAEEYARKACWMQNLSLV